MSVQALGRRLCQADMTQLLVGFFALLLFVLAVTWPQGVGSVNDSWYALVQTKTVALVLLSLAYGSVGHAASRQTLTLTLLALLCFHLLGIPFEVASYAASFPGTPLWWPLVAVTLDITAFFGVGLSAGRVLAQARMEALIPVLAPLILIGIVCIDIWIGRALLSPFTTVTTVAPAHLVVTGVLSAFTAVTLLRTAPPTSDQSEGQSDEGR